MKQFLVIVVTSVFSGAAWKIHSSEPTTGERLPLLEANSSASPGTTGESLALIEVNSSDSPRRPLKRSYRIPDEDWKAYTLGDKKAAEAAAKRMQYKAAASQGLINIAAIAGTLAVDCLSDWDKADDCDVDAAGREMTVSAVGTITAALTIAAGPYAPVVGPLLSFGTTFILDRFWPPEEKVDPLQELKEELLETMDIKIDAALLRQSFAEVEVEIAHYERELSWAAKMFPAMKPDVRMPYGLSLESQSARLKDLLFMECLTQHFGTDKCKERIAHGGLVVLIPLMEAHIALLQDLSHFAATNEQSHKERLLNAFNAVGCPNRNVDQVKIDAWKQMDDDNLKANMLSICQSSGQSSGQRALCCGDVDGCPRSCMELRHAPATMKDILMDKQRQALLTYTELWENGKGVYFAEQLGKIKCNTRRRRRRREPEHRRRATECTDAGGQRINFQKNLNRRRRDGSWQGWHPLYTKQADEYDALRRNIESGESFLRARQHITPDVTKLVFVKSVVQPTSTNAYTYFQFEGDFGGTPLSSIPGGGLVFRVTALGRQHKVKVWRTARWCGGSPCGRWEPLETTPEFLWREKDFIELPLWKFPFHAHIPGSLRVSALLKAGATGPVTHTATLDGAAGQASTGQISVTNGDEYPWSFILDRVKRGDNSVQAPGATVVAVEMELASNSEHENLIYETLQAKGVQPDAKYSYTQGNDCGSKATYIHCVGKNPANIHASVKIDYLPPMSWTLRFKMRLHKKEATAAGINFAGANGESSWIILDAKLDNEPWMVTEGSGVFESDGDKVAIGRPPWGKGKWHDYEISMWRQMLVVSCDGKLFYTYPADHYFPVTSVLLRGWRNTMDVYGLTLERLPTSTKVLHTDHQEPKFNGVYFAFNRADLNLEALTDKGYVLNVEQCRSNGTPVRKGKVRVWLGSIHAGKGGDAYGRVEPRDDDLKFEKNDEITTGSCQQLYGHQGLLR